MLDCHCFIEQQKRFYYCMFWCCFATFGFMPSVQPFSARPYGIDILHNVVIMAGLAYPAGCFFGMFVEKRSTKAITLLTIVGTMISSYIIFCATQSPNPPLKNSSIGGLLMLASQILYVAMLSYAKTMITLVLCEFSNWNVLGWNANKVWRSTWSTSSLSTN